MNVLVSGATGLVGQALCTALDETGHAVSSLLRRTSTSHPDAILWNPEAGTFDADNLDRFDAIVHLAGEPIAAGRWNEKRKARILESRVAGTRLIAEQIARAGGKPPVLISASALGFYGDRGDDVVTEAEPAGEGFLAEVCQAWEDATVPASEAGARVVNLRIGMVLAAHGGALAKMLPPFRLGLGGPLGDGRMWMSWIHLNDLVRAILYLLDTPDIHGPVNAFAPNPLTNKEFTRTLGRVLKRPACIPVPAPVLRLALGEMADALLLSSLRGTPGRLLQADFRFEHPDLEAALADLLVRAPAR
ncbi:MAG: TIGR01777 family oxidoreductase [Gammaproteobacteria bacterium]|nr:TIGR01777 family oxidoreductase [Gammaproteobacteria bacterium]